LAAFLKNRWVKVGGYRKSEDQSRMQAIAQWCAACRMWLAWGTRWDGRGQCLGAEKTESQENAWDLRRVPAVRCIIPLCCRGALLGGVDLPW